MKDLPPIIDRYCQIIDEDSASLLPEIYTNEISKQNAEKILKDLNVPKDKKLICIVPSSKHFTKTYPAEYYAEFINKFNPEQYAFLLTGKGNDKINIEKIKSQTGANVYDLCDKLTVSELAEVMKKCRLVISGDTGPMHIAEASNIPIIMLAGSSVREFGFYPQNKNAIVLENHTLKCRPCTHIGRSECPLVHFKCMREINPVTIQSVAENLIKSTT
jgi:heptosyltransferase-2